MYHFLSSYIHLLKHLGPFYAASVILGELFSFHDASPSSFRLRPRSNLQTRFLLTLPLRTPFQLLDFSLELHFGSVRRWRRFELRHASRRGEFASRFALLPLTILAVFNIQYKKNYNHGRTAVHEVSRPERNDQ